MTWVIAILLGLILVAMVSSNQAAAAGVWTVVRFILWGFAALAGWGILVGYSVWFYATYPPSGEWTRFIGVTCSVIIPPILLWFIRKDVARAYKKNKWAAVRYGALLTAYIFVMMLLGVAGREIKAAYEYGGWVMILVPLTLTGAILLWRSLSGSKDWHEVWFGPPEIPDTGEIVYQKRLAAEASNEEVWEKIRENWDELPEVQKEELRQKHTERIYATNRQLDALYDKLEAEKAERLKNDNWSVMGVFWLLSIFVAFGLLGMAWDVGFAYALELKFVKGQAWLAATVVVATGLGIAGIIASAWQSVSESRAKISNANVG